MSKKPLTPKVIARWAATHGYDYAEATRIIAAMRPESRSNVACLYRNDKLLSDDDQMAYDSIQIRRELNKMITEMEEKRIEDPDQERHSCSAPAGTWQAYTFLMNHEGCITCHPELRK